LTVVDGVWTWQAPKGKPLHVEDTTRECSEIIERYEAYTCADQFALDPLREVFARYGVHLHEAPWTASTKPTKFASARNGMTSDVLRLPDDPDLVREFCNIRAKLLRSGGEQFEAREGHDDRVHAVVGAMYEALQKEPDTLEETPEEPITPYTPAWYEAQEAARMAKYTERFNAENSDDDNSWILGPR
jgi:hypothetical protein